MNEAEWKWIKKRAREILTHYGIPPCAETRRVAVESAAEDWAWMRRAA